MVIVMNCRIAELKNKQVVCVKNGCVLGYVSDVELDTDIGRMISIIIYGKPKIFGLLGREEDIVIPWNDISVIGNETVLVETNPEFFTRFLKRNKI